MWLLVAVSAGAILLAGIIVLVATLSNNTLHATAQVEATNTPYPTYTMYPLYPTYTPYATYTPHPRATPYPTYTPYPTFTPTATPVPVVTEIDDSVIGAGSDQFNYTGSWTHFLSCSGCYQNTASFSKTTGDYVTFTFTGTRIQLICQLGNNQGYMGIRLDSTTYPDFDTYAPSTENQQLCFDSNNLPRGVHTLTLTVVGAKDINSTDYNISIDAVKITS
jgi:hypothetical protein